MEGGSNGAPGPGGGGGFLPPERGTQDMGGQEGIAIPKRQVYLRTTGWWNTMIYDALEKKHCICVKMSADCD